MTTIYTTDPHSAGQPWIDNVNRMIAKYPDAEIVFGGDYIDGRGKIDAKQTLNYVHDIATSIKNVHVLRGNHEDMLINFMDHGDPNWLMNGGKRTIKSLFGRGFSKITAQHMLNQAYHFNNGDSLYHWLNSLDYVYHNDDGLFIHAYVDFSRKYPDCFTMTSNTDKLWSRDCVSWDKHDKAQYWAANHTGVPIIFGHTPTEYLKSATMITNIPNDVKPDIIYRNNPDNPIIRTEYPDCAPMYACDGGSKNHVESHHYGTIIVFDHGEIIDFID